MTYG